MPNSSEPGGVSVVVPGDGGVNVVVNSAPSSSVNNPGSVTVHEIDVVGIEGKKGDKGDKGERGEQGPAGVSALNPYVFEQMSPAATWHIEHGLGTFPVLTVVDSAGQAVLGDVDYLSPDVVEISFSAPFSGTAYLL